MEQLKKTNVLKPKRKISLVVSDLSSSGSGRWGGAVRPFLLYKALKKLNYEVEVIGFVPHEQSSDIPSSEIPIITIPAYNYPKFIISINTLIKTIQGNIVYASKLKPTSFGVALIQKIKTRCPVLLDIDDWELSWHGGDDWTYRPSLKQFARDILKPDGALRNPNHPLYLRLTEGLVSQADVITTHTHFMQERFGGVYLPQGKDTTVFDPSQYNPGTSRTRYNLSNYRVIMFPGAPRPYKGVEDVLIALDQLNESDLRLVIVGGSPYDDYDHQLMEKWGHWIIKLPRLPVSAMPEVVAAAHIVVVPQRDTPAAKAQFPLKLTDAMAMGKPILSTRVGDIPEILADTGYLVDASSPEQIADKIRWIFQNYQDANERGKKARQRCIECYSIDKMADILSEVISQL
ncbi:MAG: glycosyltransferase family 4 protein [Coleofasciculus chthonoplastes F3-SA18-01]|uniref:glycosyltransferase family 4 protein n=1 Tax=Coleofasciculus chthonoplastes TaxID=64178 RepID=UPI0032F93254